MKNKIENNVAHVYGYVNDVKVIESKGKTPLFAMKVVTEEFYGDHEVKRTFHNVNLSTADKALVKQLKGISKDLQSENASAHTISCDGILAIRQNEKDGVTYRNAIIVADADSVKLDSPKEKNEVRNFAELKGNISALEMRDNFATLTVAEHFFVPGESVNAKGETLPYKRETTFIKAIISKERFPEAFKMLEDGTIQKGSLVSVRGQMHNNDFEDGKGVKRYEIQLDLTKLTPIVKKEKESQSEAATQKAAPKKAATAKAAPKKAKSKKALGV